MEYYLRAAGVVFVLLLLQSTFVPFLSLYGFLPDLFLIWVVYTAIRRGQVEATVSGFIVGLLQDAATTQFFGLTALCKTLAGFIAGYFYNENNIEQTLGSYRFISIVLLSSFIHNVVYFGVFLQGIEGSVFVPVLEFSGGTALYTTAFSLLPMFTFARKQRFS